ncbi:MAG TPA: hypothetical protein VMU95_08205 [Trebonia sp.]|nr:hypothetical protein [Trebonia sp.]
MTANPRASSRPQGDGPGPSARPAAVPRAALERLGDDDLLARGRAGTDNGPRA